MWYRNCMNDFDFSMTRPLITCLILAKGNSKCVFRNQKWCFGFLTTVCTLCSCLDNHFLMFFKEQESKYFMLFKYDGLSKTQVYRENSVVNSKKINQNDPAQIKLYLQMRQLSWFVSRQQWSLCFPCILNDIGYTIFVPRNIHLLQLSCNFHKYLVIFICQAKLK